MTPTDLLREWLALSENRALSPTTYDARRFDLAAEAYAYAWENGGADADLLRSWAALDSTQANGWMCHPLWDPVTETKEANLPAYWTARKQLEADTRAYLEMDDGTAD